MVEPLTLTASVIVNLAFQKFLESGAGELGKKFTTEAIAKDLHSIRYLFRSLCPGGIKRISIRLSLALSLRSNLIKLPF
jgi:hypothetical protein